VNKEILMIIAMGAGGILFALGGMGFKFLRRFVLPVILAIVAKLGGKPWKKCLAFMGSLIVAMHLPYGEKTPSIIKLLTFSAMFGATCFLGWTIWQAIGIIVTFFLFKASNSNWGKNIVFHKAWEFITGALLGLVVSSLIGR